MEILMDSDIASFTLKEANDARKIVAKKQMERIPELKGKVYDVMDKRLADYIWEVAVAPQLGYAFSMNHSLPYSFVGIQSIELATRWNPIYWDTACLIVNSGSLETDEFDIDEEWDEDTKKKSASTDYGKIAKAMGDIMNRGIKISLVDINKSGFGFEPDAANNQIMYGLKSMLNVGDDLILDIITKRPYASPKDFIRKVNPKKPAMISLIKGGAFDNMMDRKLCMGWYLWEVCDKKQRLTLQNLPSLIKYNLIPSDTEERVMARRVYEFNRYLKAVCLNKAKTVYVLDARAMDFLCEIGKDDLITSSDGKMFLDPKIWDKTYQKWMDVFRNWIAADKDAILKELNTIIFKEEWDKYATGTISAWEMEALCFYYHEHELKDVNVGRYGLADFTKLPEEPIVERSFEKGGKTINIFKLSRICGTCIAKNKTKSTVTLLTTSGVVNVKFRKEYFALFDKQISIVGADGARHVAEKSWFNRGSMIVVQGLRSGDDFVSKKYASSGGHQLYKIDAILPDGELVLKDSRYQGGIEEDV